MLIHITMRYTIIKREREKVKQPLWNVRNFQKKHVLCKIPYLLFSLSLSLSPFFSLLNKKKINSTVLFIHIGREKNLKNVEQENT